MVSGWSSMMDRRTAPTLRSAPSGGQRRSRPLVCSLVGRCQGERGSQKYTSMPRAASMSAQRAVSRPWSQAGVLRRCAGWRASAAAAAAARVVVARQVDRLGAHPQARLGEVRAGGVGRPAHVEPLGDPRRQRRVRGQLRRLRAPRPPLRAGHHGRSVATTDGVPACAPIPGSTRCGAHLWKGACRARRWEDGCRHRDVALPSPPRLRRSNRRV